MVDVSTDSPVLVTGATGYVAGWLVKKLLEAGVTVHAAVRNPDAADKRAHLDEVAANAPGEIRYFKADLMDEGSYAEAMKGCSIVFHTASPFTIEVDDPQKELIDPALLGTRNVLQSVNQTDSVERVVLTSSCAAIYTDAIDCQSAPGGILTEDVWNTTASLEYQPYSYSKTVAEKEAWKMADAQDRWKLVVCNPCVIVGPSLNAAPTSETFRLIKQLGDGTMKMGAPKLGMGMVDVRDVADAHIAAAYLPEANGRNILRAENTNFLEFGLVLQEKYGDDYPLPKKPLPKWLVWLVGPMQGIPRKFVSNNVNIEWKADNGKSLKELGLSYRPMKETMEDMFAQMIEHGHFS